ncbi:histone H3-3 type 2 [Nymphaea thermarum]|nr:histone H3-3 type 2 [Nymphaea thermarum]
MNAARKSAPTTGGVKKPHRYHLGTVALRHVQSPPTFPLAFNETDMKAKSMFVGIMYNESFLLLRLLRLGHGMPAGTRPDSSSGP